MRLNGRVSRLEELAPAPPATKEAGLEALRWTSATLHECLEHLHGTRRAGDLPQAQPG